MQIFKFWGKRGKCENSSSRPQKALPCTVATCRRGEETKKGEKRKVTNSDISRMRRDAPRSAIAPIFGSSGRVPDVVTHPKFHQVSWRSLQGFCSQGSPKIPLLLWLPTNLWSHIATHLVLVVVVVLVGSGVSNRIGNSEWNLAQLFLK